MSKSAARSRQAVTAAARSIRSGPAAPVVPAELADTGKTARGASVVETAVIIAELDKLISGRARDLEILKNIAESVKAGASRDDVHSKLLLLAKSCRDAFQSLQASRETLVSLHDTSTGGKTIAVVDPTTSFPNRIAFDAKLEEAFQKSSETCDTVLMLIEIGALQFLAGEVGAKVATRIVKRFATILARSVKHSDFIARIGPQQFGIIFRNVLPDHVMPIALRIHEAMKKGLLPGTDPIMQMLQVTIGITGNKAGDKSSADLLERAEECLPLARRQMGAGIYMA